MFVVNRFLIPFKDTHWENKPLDKIQVVTESANMGICVIDALNQLFMKGFDTRINFSEK